MPVIDASPHNHSHQPHLNSHSMNSKSNDTLVICWMSEEDKYTFWRQAEASRLGSLGRVSERISVILFLPKHTDGEPSFTPPPPTDSLHFSRVCRISQHVYQSSHGFQWGLSDSLFSIRDLYSVNARRTELLGLWLEGMDRM
jgi:hypothetical protein